ncbi:DUF1559 family PulG-like putative transporter [Roseimaritima ulvae]|uniref:DUF1559 family PulG-like putative transporter n=1 Tax=Roseimaritima ulvae TaxID=980254 RepID=UPI00143CCDF0|nr:DUF1559 domain-containing protein [Roseimaritima ulvae]
MTNKAFVNVVCRRQLVAALLLALLAGCGSSSNDPMARAKMRRRMDTDTAEANPKTRVDRPTDNPPVAAADTPRGQMPSVHVAATDSAGDDSVDAAAGDPAATVEPAATAETSAEVAAELVSSIEQRQPEQPLTESQRRERSAENIKKIAAAIIEYTYRNGEFPKPGEIKSEGGIPTLSWRVAILPYLGYDELYQQFDPNEPWDGEHNRKLLERIPDEFVSPERFDTKTNYLGPAYRTFLFGDQRIGPNGIEDGAANTILVVEVDDQFAVEWTRPQDYDAPALHLKQGLGKLRGDGAIAAWATGMPTLLPNNASEQQLMNAFTHEASDGQKAVVLHRPITIDVAAEAAQDAIAATVEPMPATPNPNVPADQSAADAATPAEMRLPVPKASELAATADRMRTVFAKRLADANAAERAALASEMIQQAFAMKQDNAGAFSLLTAATTLATHAGELGTAVEAMEAKIQLFEVDAYEENVNLLMAFGKANGGRRAAVVGGDEYVQRAIRVIYAGIAADDFSRASSIARYALMFKGEQSHDETGTMLNRLRTQLTVARGHYTRTGVALATLRANPGDRQAAEEVGRFLCFVKGDWQAGLPLLAKSEQDMLKALAAADLAGQDSPQEILAIADRWWELSDRTTQGVFRQACRDRAVMWYEAAFEQLPDSLDKLHAKARLDEAGESKATSPLALVKRLAEQSNVDLSASLAGVYRDRK